MTMYKFPLKRDDHCIWRSATATAMETGVGMATRAETATAVVTATATVTAIDVYGLRWQWPNGWWHELYFSSRKVGR